MKAIALAALIILSEAMPASAAWCVWPNRPNMPPHPCMYGGVAVAPNLGYWWGNAWILGPWHPWVRGSYRMVPHWRTHDWGRTRDWR